MESPFSAKDWRVIWQVSPSGLFWGWRGCWCPGSWWTLTETRWGCCPPATDSPPACRPLSSPSQRSFGNDINRRQVKVNFLMSLIFIYRYSSSKIILKKLPYFKLGHVSNTRECIWFLSDLKDKIQAFNVSISSEFIRLYILYKFSTWDFEDFGSFVTWHG